MVQNVMEWRLALRDGSPWEELGLPSAILTLAPGFLDPEMPAELGLLLPNADGPGELIQTVEETPGLIAGRGLGLFLADPLLNVPVTLQRLLSGGTPWIANLPSVAQHDPELLQMLEDVGLDHPLETARLSDLQGGGLMAIAVATGGETAAATAAVAPAAIFILPRVRDFAAGFPSPRQRGAAVREAAAAARGTGWDGPILALAAANEAEHEVLWPDGCDGIVCRPQALGID